MNWIRSYDRTRSFLLDVLRERSLVRGPVVLSSGMVGDYYVDCKQTLLTTVGARMAGEVILYQAKQFARCDAVAGVPTGGWPIASAASMMIGEDEENYDAIYVRKAAKPHGTRRMIDGGFGHKSGAHVVLLEDVVTSGASVLDAAHTLIGAGYVMAGVVALVDRHQGGRQAIEAAGFEFRAVYSIGEVLA